MGEILNPQRMARLVAFGSMGDYPDLEEVADRLIEATWDAPPAMDEYRQRILHAVQSSVADRMMQQASSAGNPAEVRAILSDRLEKLAARVESTSAPSPHQRLVAADIRRWQARIENTVPGPQIQMLAGDPIGGSNRN